MKSRKDGLDSIECGSSVKNKAAGNLIPTAPHSTLRYRTQLHLSPLNSASLDILARKYFYILAPRSGIGDTTLQDQTILHCIR